jgi:hypothetical protein
LPAMHKHKHSTIVLGVMLNPSKVQERTARYFLHDCAPSNVRRDAFEMILISEVANSGGAHLSPY